MTTACAPGPIHAASAAVVVARADAAQWRLALALLPELLGAPSVPGELWIAHLAGHPQRLVAAAGLVTLPRDTRRTGFRGLVRVLPAWRRRGIGRALVGELAAQVRRWDLDHLHGWTAYADGPEDAFLAACGFEPLRQVHHFLADDPATPGLLTSWIQRLRRHRRVPAHWRLVRLQDAPQDAVAALYAGHFGLAPATAAAVIARRLATPGVDALSVALLDERAPGDGALAGFLLADVPAQGPAVDLWLVSPAFRQGSAALLLLEAFAARVAGAGHGGARFHCHDETGATLGIAQRIGARPTGVQQTRALDVHAATTGAEAA